MIVLCYIMLTALVSVVGFFKKLSWACSIPASSTTWSSDGQLLAAVSTDQVSVTNFGATGKVRVVRVAEHCHCMPVRSMFS